MVGVVNMPARAQRRHAHSIPFDRTAHNVKLLSPLSTSDNARYVTHGMNTGAPDGHYAHLPQYAADVLRCTDFVRCRGGVDTARAGRLTGVIQNIGDLGKR